jgi:hypothetical protein
MNISVVSAPSVADVILLPWRNFKLEIENERLEIIAVGRTVALVAGSGAALCCHTVPDPWPLIPDPCCRM